MQRGGLRAAVDGVDLDANVFGACFGIFDKNIEVLSIIENASVDKFVLAL